MTVAETCGCGHGWDVHVAVTGGCSVCSCMAHPPNQPKHLDGPTGVCKACRLNVLARAASEAIGEHLPLSVRYKAAGAALAVIEEWENTDA